jgi:2-keto-4-pentenoate hydratase
VNDAARWLLDAHERCERFAAIPQPFRPRDADQAYAVQDAFVALKQARYGEIAGHKIALTTPQMRRMAGLDDSIAGVVLARQVRQSPAVVRAADFTCLIVEFEIACELGADLPATSAPYTRERVAQAVAALRPAFELADNRHADYARMSEHSVELIADNAWNEGAVLGEPMRDWRKIDLAGVRGVATINGKPVGEGRGGDVMGHPFEALAWVANNLARRGQFLRAGEFVITGSLVTSKFPEAGDRLNFELERIGVVDLCIE